MQGRVCKLVDGMKCHETQAVNFSGLAAIPKLIESFGLESFSRFIPEPEVQLDRNGTLGVKEIASPAPPSFSNHHRQVVDGMRMVGYGLVSQLQGSVVSLRYFCLEKQQIEIALGAVARIAHETRVVGQ